MRKTFGLCFLALTLTAGVAHAQGVFLEKGQPGVSATAGGAVIGTGWSGSVAPSYTYRGMFDVGLDVTGYGFTSGDANHLKAIGVMPFTTVYLARSEEGPSPVSISGTLGVQKRYYVGNGNAPNPDGWGLLVGGSAFRRIALTNTFAGIPEFFIAYDMQSITWHSTVLDGNAAIGPGQKTKYDHKVRLLFRANMGFQAEKTLYTLCPYLGYEAGFAAGLNVGAIF
jgi:hypothetical protein